MPKKKELVKLTYNIPQFYGVLAKYYSQDYLIIFTDKKLSRDRKHLEYLNEIWSKFYRIKNTFDSVDYSIALLNAPYSKFINSVGIIEEAYISYCNNYIHILHSSIYDQLILLINEVYCLGLDNRDANSGTVLNNQNVQNKKLKIFMQRLKKFIENDTSIKRHKNSLVHRGVTENQKQLEEIIFNKEIVKNLADLKGVSQQNIEADFQYFQDFKIKSKYDFKKMINDFRNQNETLIKLTNEILDSLSEDFSDIYEKMKLTPVLSFEATAAIESFKEFSENLRIRVNKK